MGFSLLLHGASYAQTGLFLLGTGLALLFCTVPFATKKNGTPFVWCPACLVSVYCCFVTVGMVLPGAGLPTFKDTTGAANTSLLVP